MTIEEATIDTEAATDRLSRILQSPAPNMTETQPTHPPAPNRKPRSDKGVPKVKKLSYAGR